MLHDGQSNPVWIICLSFRLRTTAAHLTPPNTRQTHPHMQIICCARALFYDAVLCCYLNVLLQNEGTLFCVCRLASFSKDSSSRKYAAMSFCVLCVFYSNAKRGSYIYTVSPERVWNVWCVLGAAEYVHHTRHKDYTLSSDMHVKNQRIYVRITAGNSNYLERLIPCGCKYIYDVCKVSVCCMVNCTNIHDFPEMLLYSPKFGTRFNFHSNGCGSIALSLLPL